jgi:hypothetical protein
MGKNLWRQPRAVGPEPIISRFRGCLVAFFASSSTADKLSLGSMMTLLLWTTYPEKYEKTRIKIYVHNCQMKYVNNKKIIYILYIRYNFI